MTAPSPSADALTGRIGSAPSDLLHTEVLEPQFRYEAEHLLTSYVQIEKVLLLEYRRMGLIGDEGAAIGALLHEITHERIVADRRANMSDIAFAIERYVETRLPAPVPAWHVDRSRNDLQSCAQLLSARDRLTAAADDLVQFGRAALDLAGRTAELPMPGYTHLQAAQIISPGFYLAGVVHEVAHTLSRLLQTYDASNRAALGAGAMAGQELAWDRDRMARLLGCLGPVPHALVAVASRAWALDLAADISSFGVALSRFATDLMAWGSTPYGFIDLPDELSGISSAMPQKKNFPILERVRGKTAHLSAFYQDFVLGQRNTPFSNMVEVSKEAGAHLPHLFEILRVVTRLGTVVLRNVRFRPTSMRAACEREYLGGFTLANLLVLHAGIPWRRAQVIAGRYITAALTAGLTATEPSAELLRQVAEDDGFVVPNAESMLVESFDVDRGLRGKTSVGSAHPDAVRALLAEQSAGLDRLAAKWTTRRETVRAATAETDQLLGLAT